MAIAPKQPVPRVDHLTDAPIIYFDAIPTFGATQTGVFNAVLAVHIGELRSSTESTDHLVAVANLRFTAAMAHQLRDALDKLLLAAAASPGSRN